MANLASTFPLSGVVREYSDGIISSYAMSLNLFNIRILNYSDIK